MNDEQVILIAAALLLSGKLVGRPVDEWLSTNDVIKATKLAADMFRDAKRAVNHEPV